MKPVLAILLICCCTMTGQTSPVFAQPNEGFSQKVLAATQGDERSRQNSLWVMEVDLKPPRLIWVETPDPSTGESERKLYLYLCYRAINRPIPVPSVRETEPVNKLDPEPGPPFFVPEFTLVYDDSDAKTQKQDEILPRVQAAINQKERRDYKNSVTIMGPVPDPTTEEPNVENALFGVAIFKNIDPSVDRFSIYMNGFSNGYDVQQGPDGNPLVLRKTIQQKFWRPGDEFDPESIEFRFDGEPEWVYRPDATTN